MLLPLPPQVVSLSDLAVTVNGEPSQDVSHENGRLVWTGTLNDSGRSKLHIGYAAVGKGIYTLERPPGKIIERFQTSLTAHKSNIRMLQLSLQPKELSAKGGDTTYLWDYRQLLVSRPIALDVLGIAAEDRLGQIIWLGPLSVFIYAMLAGLALAAFRPEELRASTVLLIVGCFAASYPLMYFLQEFVSLPAAVLLAAGVSLLIIVIRGMLLLGGRAGLATSLLPALVMTLTVLAAIYSRPAIQGMLLTLLALVTLVTAMVLLPRARSRLDVGQAKPESRGSVPPPPPEMPR